MGLNPGYLLRSFLLKPYLWYPYFHTKSCFKKYLKKIVKFYYHYGHILELLSDLMGQKKIFAVVRVLNGVGLIVRALHKDAFWKEILWCGFFIKSGSIQTFQGK